MYKSLNYFWPIQDTAAVCLTQDTVLAGPLVLNGTYVTSGPTISFADRGFARKVSLTSTNDLSTAVFRITGVQNSTPLSVLINGPLGGPGAVTVETTEYFDIISSVSVDQAVTGVSIGTGLEGAVSLFSITSGGDPLAFSTSLLQSASNGFALGFNTQAVNGCTYQIYQSLSNLVNNGQTYLGLIGNSTLFPDGSPHSNVTQIIQSADICYNILVQVTSTDNNSTLQTQFLQL